MKILIVEDDVATSTLLQQALTSHHYAVDLAHDGAMGLEFASTVDYDLILLDLLIPKLDGISLCRRLREQDFTQPILLLTAKGSNDDIVTGLDAGADDYVTKPFKVSELLARIRALLRRGTPIAAPILSWGELALNPATTTATYQDQVLALTAKEYSLLELFLRHPQRVFSRTAVIDHLWALSDLPSEHAVTNLTKDLRRKLKNFGMKVDPIETIYGLGYRLKSPPLSPEFSPPPPAPDEAQVTDPVVNPVTPSTPIPAVGDSSSARSLQATLTALRPIIDQQVAVLETVGQALQAKTLTPTQQEQAQTEAHKLAGSLGTFGYVQASAWAKLLEYWLMGWQRESEAIALFGQFLEGLKQEIKTPPTLIPVTSSPALPAIASPITLSVMSTDQDWMAPLLAEPRPVGIQINPLATPAAVYTELNRHRPQGILLDIAGITASPAVRNLLQNLRRDYPDVPVFVVTDEDELHLRVQVSRLGARQFFLKSTPPALVLSAVNPWLTDAMVVEGHVLVVDDDPVMLRIAERLLEPWGLHITTLSDPTQFWTVLNTIAPDLLLLDISMPAFSGIDLCSVVRQDPRWGNLPILALTGHTEVEFIQKIFAAGADDVIHKPIIPPELVTSVVSRIERLQRR